MGILRLKISDIMLYSLGKRNFQNKVQFFLFINFFIQTLCIMKRHEKSISKTSFLKEDFCCFYLVVQSKEQGERTVPSPNIRRNPWIFFQDSFQKMACFELNCHNSLLFPKNLRFCKAPFVFRGWDFKVEQ